MNDYKILSRFECYGKNMVIVIFKNNAHVMEVRDLKRIQRNLRLKGQKRKWKIKVA